VMVELWSGTVVSLRERVAWTLRTVAGHACIAVALRSHVV
jgi:hypothetical protein